MKKILFVANVAKEHINKFHLPTIKELKKRGWQVDVACEADVEVPYCDHLYAAKWKRTPFTVKTLQGVKQLKNILNKEYYDVVYCHTPVGGFVARAACSEARKKGTKVIYFAHGLHFFDGAPKKNWIFYQIEQFMAYKTDAMFLLNDEDYWRVKREFNSKLFVKEFPGIGVDFNRISVENPKAVRSRYRNNLHLNQDDIVLIYIAELITNKNQGYLLKALKKIKEIKNNVKLLLVGPDHSEGKYVEMAQQMGISEDVIFAGWRNDVGALLCTSDICVASSIREGFGINLVEAMYHGLPVVAVKNRGHSTVIQDGKNGFLVSLDDSDKMAERVIEIIDNKEIREKFSGIDVSKYDARDVAIDIVNTIEGLL